MTWCKKNPFCYETIQNWEMLGTTYNFRMSVWMI